MKRRVTLADVALIAGVSAITVSRVINQPDKVSPVMREKIQKAIDELGYIPNRSASALASARSGVIGVAIPSLSNVVFNDVLRGIYDVAGPSGFQILLVDTLYSPFEEERMVRTLLSQSPEAMIVTGGDQTEITRKLLSKAGIPVVQIMETLDDPIDMNVGFSQQQASYDVVRELLKRGYTKIAYIGARMDRRTQQSLTGYRTAMEERDLLHKEFIVTTPRPSSVGVGGELFHSLISNCNGECEAVCCSNDDLALGVLFESQRMNLSVPGDIALCGFNDVEIAALVNPSLSSVYVPRYEMGAIATRMVLSALSGDSEMIRKVDQGYELKMRASVSSKH